MYLTCREDIVIRNEHFVILIFDVRTPDSEYYILNKDMVKPLLMASKGFEEHKILNRCSRRESSILDYLKNEGILVNSSKPKPFIRGIPRKNMLSAPYLVTINPTFRCNLKCWFCFRPKNESNQFKIENELTIEDYYKLFTQLKESGVFLLEIMGGEPFLKDDLLDILKLANKFPFRITISTNGTLIDSLISKELEKLDFKKILFSVSILGYSKSIHDNITGIKGSYEKTISGINELQKCNIPFILNYIVVRDNIDDKFRLLASFRKYHISRLNFLFFHEVGWGKSKRSEYLSPYEFRSAVEDIKKLNTEKYDNYFKITYRAPFQWRIDKKIPDDYFAKHYYSRCMLRGRMDILPDGSASPCLDLAEYGYIEKDAIDKGIENIWVNSKIIKKARKRTELILEQCKGCDTIEICKNQCLAYVLGKGGNFYSPDDRCPRISEIGFTLPGNKNVDSN